MAEENKKGLGAQFKEALSYMGPRLFAQLIGGSQAMHTTDQLLKGVEQSQRAHNQAQRQKVNDDFDRRMKMANFELKKQQVQQSSRPDPSKDTDYKQYVHKETRQPVGFHKPSETFYLLGTNQKLSADEVMDEKIFLGEGVASRFGETHGWKKHLASQFSGKQTEKDEGFRGTKAILNNLSKWADKISNKLGPAAGRAGSIALTLGKDSPDFQYFKTQSEAFIQQYARTKQGGRLTDQDLEFNRMILPNQNDTIVNLQAKVRAVQDMIAMEEDAFYGAIRDRQPVKAEAIRTHKLGLVSRLQKELEAPDQKAPKQEKQKSGPISVKTPSGRKKLISIEEAKKMGIL